MKKKSTIDFIKMTGAGNDFVLIDNRALRYTLNWQLLAPDICDRRYGVGADGLLVITPAPHADFTMEYYNADGSSGGMCGNGGRCAASYVMRESKTQETKFLALDYRYHARILSESVITLKMKNPQGIRLHQYLEVLEQRIPYHFIDTGSPHVVIFSIDLPGVRRTSAPLDFVPLGKAVRHHQAFSPIGTNMNLVDIMNDTSIKIRTYERGVEAETLACGTGSIACAILTSLVHDVSPPITVLTKSEERMRVFFKKNGEAISDVELEGPVKTVFVGNYTHIHGQ